MRCFDLKQLLLTGNYSSRKGQMALLLALLASLFVVAGATAHALLLKSEPETGAVLAQPPQRVIAWFSQELDTGFSTLLLLDAQGRQVDNGDGGVDLNDPDHASLIVTLPPSLPPGVYTAHWTAVSAEDGDTTEGEFTFNVGEVEVVGQVSPVEVTSISNEGGWVVGWIVVGLAVLLIIVMFSAWRPLSNRGS